MYDHAPLAIFLNFAGFIFIVYVGRKKMRWPPGGKFELPTWFITLLKGNSNYFSINLSADYNRFSVRTHISPHTY
jgi:hypothetical protein